MLLFQALEGPKRSTGTHGGRRGAGLGGGLRALRCGVPTPSRRVRQGHGHSLDSFADEAALLVLQELEYRVSCTPEPPCLSVVDWNDPDIATPRMQLGSEAS